MLVLMLNMKLKYKTDTINDMYLDSRYVHMTYVCSKLWVLLCKEWKLKGNLQSEGNQIDPADIFKAQTYDF